VPHLIALATASNIGSVGTITGNPQNIFIGSHSGISYLRFAERLMPVAGLGLALNFAVVAFLYRGRLVKQSEAAIRLAYESATKVAPIRTSHSHEENPRESRRWVQTKSLVVTLATVALFFTGLPLELIALGAAAVLLVDRIKPEKVYRQVDWALLVLFTGLFIVVHAFQIHVVSTWGIEGWDWLLNRPVSSLSLVSPTLSNVVSNVPAVLLLEPIIQAMPAVSRETAWLALAMSSTLAGNLTVLGSVANLIVVEKAKREGVVVGFMEYCKVGIPLTILTLMMGIAWLEFVHY
jgi:Na+/H+ antiporter NhaD/arsenite permease-like protein